MIRLDEHNKAISLAKTHLRRFALSEKILLSKYSMLKASLLIHLTKDIKGNSPSYQCNNQGRFKAIRLDEHN